MTKIKRVWRAFCCGFWHAWFEVPPKKYTAGEVTMTLSCNTEQFDQAIDGALLRMQRFAQQANMLGLN